MDNGSESIIDYQQSEESLLSSKMQKLQPKTNCSVTTNLEEVPIFALKQKNSPLLQTKIQSLDKNRKRSKSKRAKMHELKKKKKQKEKKQMLVSLRTILKKKGMTLFEKSNESGRNYSYVQVKQIPVSQFSGEGLLILPNKKRYQGEWVEGQLIGTVKINYPNGDMYIGLTYEYERHGRGEVVFENGRKYVGEFSGNDFHGEGVLYDKQGNVLYDGLWRRGQKWDK